MQRRKIFKRKIYSMIKLQGIQVDVVGSVDFLLAEHALFTIEFEYDSKLLVCHACAVTVKRALEKLIRKILGPKETNLSLRQALLQSEYITVQVKKLNTNRQHKILEAKYELIRNNMTYEPYGHNSLSAKLDKNEKIYANMLMASLKDEIDKNAKISIENEKQNNFSFSRAKEVHAYDKITGAYIKSFSSITEASDATGVCQSNISMCCKGDINTAGKYIWSFEKKQIAEIPEDRRKKQPKTPPTAAELQLKRLYFIKNRQS